MKFVLKAKLKTWKNIPASKTCGLPFSDETRYKKVERAKTIGTDSIFYF